MGVFDDVGRIYDASKNNPRPGLIDGIKQAADAAEKAQKMKASRWLRPAACRRA